MKPAIYKVTAVSIEAGEYQLSASGSILDFAGFTAAYNDNVEDDENGRDKPVKNTVPFLSKGDILELLKVLPSQHFTKPPGRYSDSSLIKALEEDGIGRPSTYAPIIYTLIMRDYVRRVKGYFNPTELGFKVCDLLVEYFPKIVDVGFTALMEEELMKLRRAGLISLRSYKIFIRHSKSALTLRRQM